MKGLTIFKKVVSLLSVAAVCSSFAVVAQAANELTGSYTKEVTYGNVIQFSTYAITQGTEERVKDPGFDLSGTTCSEIALDENSSTRWPAGVLSKSAAKVCDSAVPAVVFKHSSTYKNFFGTVTIKDVPAGYYDVYQSIPGTGSVAITINIDSVGGTACSTTSPITDTTDSNVWQSLGSVYIDGVVTFTYSSTSTGNNTWTRLDQTKLVRKGAYAEFVDNIDSENDGDEKAEASVWKATVAVPDDDKTYTNLIVTAKDSEGKEKEGTIINNTAGTLSGNMSVYVAIAVNKAKEDLASENPIFVTFN